MNSNSDPLFPSPFSSPLSSVPVHAFRSDTFKKEVKTMNLYGLYVIRDEVSEKCSAPFVAESDRLAFRQVRVTFTGRQFLEDYTLLRVASWDESTGLVKVEENSYESWKVIDIINSGKEVSK